MPESSPVTALLGPTNTGKTHRAVQRMLEHDTGMLGLPLRLLAREVYDRLTVRLGESAVALVTGEEKRVPKRPRYWVCTVEAMPVGRDVDFLAVDEIQLAAHDQRGHVFTDRLLHARGKKETWFLGAETIRALVAELVPAAKIQQHPRLSRLSGAGTCKLSKLPPRSAVVGFGAAQVYEVAERLRALRGGAAVVLGALSPRTRNAQVALFQSGEVDYLVATDAIGMGLNLDVDHVAFAGLRKFDGRNVRDLDAAELAQIAGRAGRYLSDGTFGTLAPLMLAPVLSEAIENNRFPLVERVLWRNSDLEFNSIESLMASLRAKPSSRRLRPVDEAEDMEALLKLTADEWIRSRARGKEAVELLWEVCRIPDFRKLFLDTHAALLSEIYKDLAGSKGFLDNDWMELKIHEIDDVQGDIDTLIDRIASIRTFTFISNHTQWVKDAEGWQERTRQIEDRLSDALHDQLVLRFVERGAARKSPYFKPRSKPLTDQKGRGAGDVGKESAASGAGAKKGRGAESKSGPKDAHPFAKLLELRESLAAEKSPVQPSADEAWISQLVEAGTERFSVNENARIVFDNDQVVGKLSRGPGLLLPEARLLGVAQLGTGAGGRTRLLRRFSAFARDWVEELLAPVRALNGKELSAAGRGLLYMVEQGLGTALLSDVKAQAAELSAAERALIFERGIVIGERVVYVPALLSIEALFRRMILGSIFFYDDREPRIQRITKPLPSIPVFYGNNPKMLTAIGYPIFGGRGVRADIVEKAAHAFLAAQNQGDDSVRPLPPPSEKTLAKWFGCSRKEAVRVADAIAKNID